jgi:type I restriction enzyme R subunit
VSPEEEAEPRAKEALTEYLVKLRPETQIIVERIVTDIDEIVKKVRFPD